MKHIILSIISLSFMITLSHAATLAVSGQTQASDQTNQFPWVGGSVMWEKIDSSSNAGTENAGFTSIPNPELFTFTYGTLELTDHLSPGAASPGFEIYSEGNIQADPAQFFYDGVLWATGELSFLRVDVLHNQDFAATGSGEIVLTVPGESDLFFNEVMSLTNGSGTLVFDIDGFFPINQAGLFSSTGTMTAVPEPATYASIFGLIALLIVMSRRRMIQA